MSPLTGTGALVRLTLRRDRVRIPVWIIAIAGSVLASVASFPEIYPTAATRQARAVLMNNPATVVLTGPGYGLDNYTYGAMTANEMLGFTAIVVALMSILLVVRHLRTEEESGRAELVRATVVGRHAATAATLVVVGGVNVALGLLLGLGLPAAVPELPLAGSLLFGASIAAVGLVFAAAAAFTSQLTEHARGATGLASALLGVAFALRAAGDLGEGTLSWLSPLGWAQRTRAYVDGRWWPLLLALGLTVLLGAAAFVLGARRDVGAGLMPARRGRAAASGALVRPLGLALRLQRGILTGWGVGLLLFGVFIGSLAEEAGDFLAGNETARQFLARFGGMDNLTDSVLATYMFMLALVATGYAVQAAMVLRGEETAGRVEPLLGTPLARTRWAGSHLAVAVLGSTVIVGGAGLGAGVMYAASTGDWGQLPRVLAAAVAHLPALWVFVGLAAALFGLAPRAVGLTWVGLVGAVFVGILGPLLQLPDWVYDLSPFGHTPQLPAADFTPGPLAALTAIAAGLMAVGLVAFRRRDAG